MTNSDDRRAVEAAALLRGDLPALRPDTWEATDAALDQALQEPDIALAAGVVREVAAKEHLSARLRQFERGLATGLIANSSELRDLGGFCGDTGQSWSGARDGMDVSRAAVAFPSTAAV